MTPRARSALMWLLAAVTLGIAILLIDVLPERLRGPSEEALVTVPPPPPGAALVPVPGGAVGVLPVAAADRKRITDRALSDAVTLANRTDSQALLIWRDGALQLEHYGRGARPSDRLASADLHASLLGLLIGPAVKQGVLRSADQPLAELLPQWATDPRGRITVRQLVEGTSGLAAPAGGGDPLQATLAAPPGARRAPSAIEALVLGRVLEVAAKETYAELLSDWLWQPIGARDAAVTREGSGLFRTDCCLEASARDWLRVGILLLERGRMGSENVVPADWIAALTTPAADNPNAGLRVLLAWPHRQDPEVGFRATEAFVLPDTLFLAGAGGQRLYVSRSANLVIVRLGAARADWDDSVLPNLVARGLIDPPPPAVTPHVPKGGPTEMPPIPPPPAVPKVQAVPLAAPEPAPSAPPAGSGSSRP